MIHDSEHDKSDGQKILDSFDLIDDIKTVNQAVKKLIPEIRGYVERQGKCYLSEVK
jgi:hypothetical protein